MAIAYINLANYHKYEIICSPTIRQTFFIKTSKLEGQIIYILIVLLFPTNHYLFNNQSSRKVLQNDHNSTDLPVNGIFVLFILISFPCCLRFCRIFFFYYISPTLIQHDRETTISPATTTKYQNKSYRPQEEPRS